MDEFQEQFKKFCKFGDTKSKGDAITLTSTDKWFRQAKFFDKPSNITGADTAIYFNKIAKGKKTLSYKEFLEYLDTLAKAKKMDIDEVKVKLLLCGDPGTTSTTAAVKVGAVDRLTDTSAYTGTHKERFDASGKGKGIEGRQERAENTGYVGGYKGAGTYDKSRKKN
ncbi:TPPP family protein CG45057-like [Centruroides sculpturatus]|uniref:TPPP family protein CG45057-like n=1 Tax=Centruroides sculpturatus TaxID=218467 RepID=UPI000C6C95E3|nr:TPPP family protein CG45057-like [Centruroides sculpturatus]